VTESTHLNISFPGDFENSFITCAWRMTRGMRGSLRLVSLMLSCCHITWLSRYHHNMRSASSNDVSEWRIGELPLWPFYRGRPSFYSKFLLWFHIRRKQDSDVNFAVYVNVALSDWPSRQHRRIMRCRQQSGSCATDGDRNRRFRKLWDNEKLMMFASRQARKGLPRKINGFCGTN
jgi:hypothetical protein